MITISINYTCLNTGELVIGFDISFSVHKAGYCNRELKLCLLQCFLWKCLPGNGIYYEKQSSSFHSFSTSMHATGDAFEMKGYAMENKIFHIVKWMTTYFFTPSMHCDKKHLVNQNVGQTSTTVEIQEYKIGHAIRAKLRFVEPL